MTKPDPNLKALEAELKWFTLVLDTRFKLYFNNECKFERIQQVNAPELDDRTSSYAAFVNQHQLTLEERLAIILALVPHLQPELLDSFFTRNASYDRSFSEFGGYAGKTFKGFLPTGETLLFLATGNDFKTRVKLGNYFLEYSGLFKNNILRLGGVDGGEPVMSGLLSINPEYLSFFTSGSLSKPDYSPNFPAKLITTPLEWEELVLEPHVMHEVEEIRAWINWSSRLEQDAPVRRILKRGYRSLFYGPPGTGKTLTVSLLGKITGKDVYKIDLSMIVSKYIGETEKNLSAVFDQAENKNWILFFDEADALFGKRTATTSSNDRYANQEIAYLLQRIEDFPGLIILATNLKSNLDDAFARRFQSMIHFPMPGPQERLTLWEHAFREGVSLEENSDFKKIAEKYTLSGGAIVNVLMHSLLQSQGKDKVVSEHTILEGIKKELKKEGKTI